MRSKPTSQSSPRLPSPLLSTCIVSGGAWGRMARPSSAMDSPELSFFSRFAEADRLMEALLCLSEPGVVELSLERLIDQAAGHSERSDTIERAMSLGLRIQKAAGRSARKQASAHNAVAWSLPHDLTVRVFSLLDTRSICHAAATCSMFNKCAMDSLCYANIDLTSAEPKVNNTVVFAMLQRAGKNLQSLKLGILPVTLREARPYQSMVSAAHSHVDTSSFSWHDRRSKQGKESCVLTRSCLLPLSLGDGATGGLLRQLHLYNIDSMDTGALSTALSVCQSLIDFAVVGLNVNLRQILKSLSSSCSCLEHLFFEYSGTGGDESLKSSTCVDLVNGCPLLSSLTLRGFKLSDHKARILLQGFQRLKLIDFSSAYSVTGIFLRSLSNCAHELLLEVLILRDCMHLKEVEVDNFLCAILQGECKSLRYLDISNKDGLAAAGDWFDRSYNPSDVSIKRVLSERPEIHFVAEFPIDKSSSDLELAIDDQVNSDISTPYTFSPMSLENSFSMGSSDGSYSSDPSSGNEDVDNVGYAFYEEFSDGVEYFML